MAQLTKAQLLQAYRTMRTIREFEERVHTEFATGEIPGFVHLYAGEEASATGVCVHLRDDDYIASTHRGHGHCIAKGVDPVGMMAEIYGKSTGTCKGKGGSMHIADLSRGMMGANGIVGGGGPLICGAALAAKYKRENGVAVCFFGDGASNEVKKLREEKDCLLHFRKRVTSAGELLAAELDAVDKDVLALIDRAVKQAKADPKPEAADLLTDVYVSYP